MRGIEKSALSVLGCCQLSFSLCRSSSGLVGKIAVMQSGSGIQFLVGRIRTMSPVVVLSGFF
jgi:hypothetical protein